MPTASYPTYPTIQLKVERDKSLLHHHAWVFSGAINKLPEEISPGALVDIQSASGNFMGRGYFNPRTDIALRVLTWDRQEAIDRAFFVRRIRQAAQVREVLAREQTTGFRLINAEGDFLPGLIVDSYAGYLVVQLHTAGIERLLPDVLAALEEVTGTPGILLRNDVKVRAREGLKLESPRALVGEVPPEVIIEENGLLFLVDLWTGQKTGFFLDQRDRRRALQKYAPGKRVLNCFSYTGAFSVAAAMAGKQAEEETLVTSVDYSPSVLELAQRNFEINGLDPLQHTFVAGDAFDYLEHIGKQEQLFDIVILDPPAFAKTLRAKPQALQSYRKLNKSAMSVLKPGGLLLTCSCSGNVSLDEFQFTVTQAGLSLGRAVQALEVFEQGLDHPISLASPESKYLKALFCRVL